MLLKDFFDLICTTNLLLILIGYSVIFFNVGVILPLYSNASFPHFGGMTFLFKLEVKLHIKYHVKFID